MAAGDISYYAGQVDSDTAAEREINAITSNLVTAIDELRDRVRELEGDVDNLTDERDTLQGQVDDLTAERNSLQADVATLESQLAEA